MTQHSNAQAYDADYAALIKLFVLLVQSQAGTRIEPDHEWLHDAEKLAIKLFRHLVSVKGIAADTTLGGDGIPTMTFVDHASTKVIARAAFETYLVFFYIYGNPDRSLCEFRHAAWQLGGLSDRQKSHASTDQSREILAAEKKEIEELRTTIAASPHFRAYTDKRGKKLLDGDWRIGTSWADLGKNAGFHETYFKNVYGYLSGYSHSSYISAMQVWARRSRSRISGCLRNPSLESVWSSPLTSLSATRMCSAPQKRCFLPIRR